jgi:hypothetical protein
VQKSWKESEKLADPAAGKASHVQQNASSCPFRRQPFSVESSGNLGAYADTSQFDLHARLEAYNLSMTTTN